MLQTLLDQFLQNSGLELLAVVLAVAYLLLAVKENDYCWHAAFFSTLLPSGTTIVASTPARDAANAMDWP